MDDMDERDLISAPPPKNIGSGTLIRCHSMTTEKLCGICQDEDILVGSGSFATDIRLGCNCPIHYDCFVDYIKSCLGDRSLITKDGINCPYYSKQSQSNACQSQIPYFIRPVDLNALIDFGRIHTDVCSSFLHETEVAKLQNFMKKEKQIVEIKETDEYIEATTKPCPECKIRTTHYHGHNCHHISPVSDGCPNCHTHYCYRCLSTEDSNVAQRAQRSACECGFWSQYCKPISNQSDIDQYLTLEPVPFDNRCGCVICPECAFESPCPQCPGNCEVCVGHLNPGPLSVVGPTWVALPSGRVPAVRRHQIYSDLCRACMHGNTWAVEALLMEGEGVIDVNKRDRLGRNALDYACDVGNVKIIRMLVERGGAVVNSFDREGLTPLLRCCEYGHEAGARFLIAAQADTAARDRAGETSLMKACRNNHTGIACLLAQVSGVDLNVVTERDRLTPLHYATHYDNTDMALALLRAQRSEPQRGGGELFPRGDIDVNVQNADGFTALHWAIMSGNVTIVGEILRLPSVLVDVSADDGNTALHLAALYEREGMARVLAMEHGCNVDAMNIEGNTALHLACKRGCAGIVRTLVHERRCAVSTTSFDGSTPLHSACQRGFADIVKTIIEAALNEGNEGNEGGDGINTTASSSFPSSDTSMKSCDEHISPVTGSIPDLDVGERGKGGDGERKGGDNGLVPQPDRSSSSSSALWVFGVRTKADNATPLHFAAFHGHDDIVAVILRALEVAAEIAAATSSTSSSATSTSLSSSVIAVGLRAAVVDAQAADGYTPLMYACRNNHSKCIKLLIEHGASVALQSPLPPPTAREGADDVPENIISSSPSLSATISTYSSAMKKKRMPSQGSHSTAAVTSNRLQDGKTALHWTCYHGNMGATKLLLGHWPSKEQTNPQGPVMGGGGGGGGEGRGEKGGVRAKGRDRLSAVDVRDSRGCTPLYKACEKSHVEVAKLLFTSHHANPEVLASDGSSPTSMAASNCLLELLMLF